MNFPRSVAYLGLMIAFPMIGLGQDSWLFSAKPPIVTRYEGSGFKFTNTSDAPIHGITLHVVKDGQESSRVIIDTIEPHKTVSVPNQFDIDLMTGATITCANYSKPLKVSFP